MTAMPNISCRYMVMKHGHIDPKKITHLLASQIDVPKIIYMMYILAQYAFLTARTPHFN
ncbi:hypothetical protein M8C21_023248 [Ambrosia artemisiifolia]|uniref:Uncharacterized protein n=1 Tax=Ambrosia artemisiifolia TaxID=4212 RepID=A0AAD5CY85_AMBAR|nr:hypothetical protein M8C21_023248 [Ambrosia artemisiifolia]